MCVCKTGEITYYLKYTIYTNFEQTLSASDVASKADSRQNYIS